MPAGISNHFIISRNAGKHNTHTRGIFLDVADNLVNLRTIAKELLGFKADEKVIPDGDNIPQALADFINGSPNEHGCTATAMEETIRVLEEQGIETEMLWLGKKD